MLRRISKAAITDVINALVVYATRNTVRPFVIVA